MVLCSLVWLHKVCKCLHSMPPHRYAHGALDSGSCTFLPFTIAFSLRFLPCSIIRQLPRYQMDLARFFERGHPSRPDNGRTEVWPFSSDRSNCTLNRCPDFDFRVYAVTERNKRLGGVLLSLSVTQVGVGIAMIVRAAVGPSEFFSSFSSARRLRSTLSATAAGDRPGHVQTLRCRAVEIHVSPFH